MRLFAPRSAGEWCGLGGQVLDIAVLITERFVQEGVIQCRRHGVLMQGGEGSLGGKAALGDVAKAGRLKHGNLFRRPHEKK